MNWIFFASVAVFIWLFGLCRQMMIEANKNALTAKKLYHDSLTTYLDNWDDYDAGTLYSRRKGMDNESVLHSGNDH